MCRPRHQVLTTGGQLAIATSGMRSATSGAPLQLVSVGDLTPVRSILLVEATRGTMFACLGA